MNDDELRAFLESATVGDSEPEPEDEAPEQPAELAPTVVPATLFVPPAPAAGPQPGPTFDELIGLRRQQAADPDPVPLVLPEPPKPAAAEPGVTPLQLPVPPRATPVPGAIADTQPPTQPLSRADLPVPPVPTAPIVPAAPPAPIVPPVLPAAAPAAPLPADAADPLLGLIPPTPPTGGGDDYEKIAVTGGSDRNKFLPWIIVGAGAAIALVASVVIINLAGGGATPEPTAAPAPTETTTTQSATTPTEATQTPTTTPKPVQPTSDQPPQVDVGQTMALDVPFWNITADLSTRFGQTSYVIDGENRLVLTSALINSLPESCAAMRSEWGILRTGETTFEVLKPAQRCADAPEVFDELWGLTAAMVKSIRPQA